MNATFFFYPDLPEDRKILFGFSALGEILWVFEEAGVRVDQRVRILWPHTRNSEVTVASAILNFSASEDIAEIKGFVDVKGVETYLIECQITIIFYPLRISHVPQRLSIFLLVFLHILLVVDQVGLLRVFFSLWLIDRDYKQRIFALIGLLDRGVFDSWIRNGLFKRLLGVCLLLALSAYVQHILGQLQHLLFLKLLAFLAHLRDNVDELVPALGGFSLELVWTIAANHVFLISLVFSDEQNLADELWLQLFDDVEFFAVSPVLEICARKLIEAGLCKALWLHLSLALALDAKSLFVDIFLGVIVLLTLDLFDLSIAFFDHLVHLFDLPF